MSAQIYDQANGVPAVDFVYHSSPEYSSLSGLRRIYKPNPTDRGFRLSYFNGGDVVGVVSCSELIITEIIPEDLKVILESPNHKGIPTFTRRITVSDAYIGKGYGLPLFKMSQELLTLIAGNSFNTLITDDSLRGWTQRQLPEIKEHMKSLGYDATDLWSGEVENHDSFLINWKKSNE